MISNLIRKIDTELQTMTNEWCPFEVNPVVLRDIEFFRNIGNVRLLDADWDGKSFNLRDKFVVFCYSHNLKKQRPDLWKSCFSDFMYFMQENPEYSFNVINFDICRPNEVASCDQIHLFKTLNGLICPLFGQLNQIAPNNTESKTLEQADKNEDTKKQEINVLLVVFFSNKLLR